MILVRYLLDRLYLLGLLRPAPRDGYPRVVRGYRYPVIRGLQRGRVDGGVGLQGVDRRVDEARLHAHVDAGDGGPDRRLGNDRLGGVGLGGVGLGRVHSGRVRLGRVRPSHRDLFRRIFLARAATIVRGRSRVRLLPPLIERIPAPLGAGSVAFEHTPQLFGKQRVVVVTSAEIISDPSAKVIIRLYLFPSFAFRLGIII